MISYPFISDLFKNVLSKSKGIDGRFFVCPHMGTEINSDTVGQLITDLVNPLKLDKKYPLCLMMPPISYGFYTKGGEWERYRVILFFLTTTFYSAGKIVNSNISTKTSTHTIPQDWHDMKRCAVNFITVLNLLSRSKKLINTHLRLDQEREQIITPISQVGVDKASGVRLDLFCSGLISCEIEDYDEGEIDGIVIPEDDSHPEHAL